MTNAASRPMISLPAECDIEIPHSLEIKSQVQLKSLCVEHRLRVGGNKPELKRRLAAHFLKIGNAARIQRVFRGFVARRAVWLRGPGFKCPAICVNETDFYSLDPICELPKMRLITYMDAKGFVYGFDLWSLMTMYAKTRRFVNPYNREDIPIKTVCDIFSIHMKTEILWKRPTATDTETNDYPSSIEPPADRAQSKLRYLRANLTVDERIREVFMEIDLLGNYTQSWWFSGLNCAQLYAFYANYREFWTSYALTSRVRSKICAVPDPFMRDIEPEIEAYRFSNILAAKTACTDIIELMVYTGADQDYRAIGALQALTILTQVSSHAREALPWL